MIHPHHPRKNSLRLQLRQNRLQRNFRPSEGQRTWPIDRRNRHRSVMAGDQTSRVLFPQPYRQHRARTTRTSIHKSCPKHDDSRPLFNTKNTRHTRRRDLPNAVPHHRHRINSPRLPQSRQRNLHRKNRWLGNLCPVHLRRLFRSPQLLEQRKTRPRLHRLRTPLHRLPKNWLNPHQFPPHSPPLWPLTAHHKSHPWSHFPTRRKGGPHFRTLLLYPESIELLNQLRDRTRSHRQPVRMMIPPRTQGVNQVRQQRGVAVRMRTRLNPLRQLQSRTAQGFFRSCRKDDRPHPIHGLFRVITMRNRWRLFENNVGISTTEPTRIHSNHSPTWHLRKCLKGGVHPQP